MPSTDTRQRLVFAAMTLFHRQGYEATSVEEILTAANANSGSLYYYFRSKEELLLAVLDAYLEGLWPVVMQPAFDRASDPIDAIFEVLKDYRERVRSSDFTYSCPIGSLALEVGASSEAARQKVAQNFANWCAAIRTRLDAAADRLPPDLDKDQLATHVLSVMEGGVMLARTHRSLVPFDAAVTQLESYVRGLVHRGPDPPDRASGHRRTAKPAGR
jgi:TetR/AcrR family transcriptional repressor of nem operon